MNISPDSWMQLFSGFAAVLVAIMAIIYGNKNSRKAIQQQNRILEYQHNEKRLDEYRKCWDLSTAQLALVLDTMMEYVNYLFEFASNIENVLTIKKR